MRSLEFDPLAFEDLEWWVEENRKKALKIINMIKEIQRDPYLRPRKAGKTEA